MLKCYNYTDWLIPSKLLQPIQPTEIFPDISPRENYRKSNSSFVYLQVEPAGICNSREYLLKNWNKFKYVITHDDILLSQLPNAVQYVFGGCWISPEHYNNIDITLKKFQISTLVHNLLRDLLGYDGCDFLLTCADCYSAS